MLSVLLIWMYMLFTCYVAGFACIRMIFGKENFRCKRETGYLYAGVGAVTVYAQFFSIFGKVGLAANLLLLLACGACIFLFRKEMGENFHALRLTTTPVKAAVADAVLQAVQADDIAFPFICLWHVHGNYSL